MNEFIMFLSENATWLLVVVALIIIIIIGFLVDKKKTDEKVTIKPSAKTNDVPTFIHNENNPTEKKPETTFADNNQQTMAINQNENRVPFINNMTNSQPATMQSPVNNNIPGVFAQSMNPVNNQQPVNRPNMQMQQPMMNNNQNNQQQQLQGIGNTNPLGFAPTQNNMQQPKQPVNGANIQPQPPMMNQTQAQAPVHEPIKVTPIPGMSGSAVSFVNGPMNNNQNQ